MLLSLKVPGGHRKTPPLVSGAGSFLSAANNLSLRGLDLPYALYYPLPIIT